MNTTNVTIEATISGHKCILRAPVRRMAENGLYLGNDKGVDGLMGRDKGTLTKPNGKLTLFDGTVVGTYSIVRATPVQSMIHSHLYEVLCWVGDDCVEYVGTTMGPGMIVEMARIDRMSEEG